MSSYALINKETQTLQYYSSLSLFHKYLMEDFVGLSDIKEVGNTEFLITKLKQQGVLVFNVNDFGSLGETKIKLVGANEQVFDNLVAAIQYCKDKGFSNAGDSYIRNTLTRHLDGKTKAAYGRKWEYTFTPLDVSDYKIEVII